MTAEVTAALYMDDYQLLLVERGRSRKRRALVTEWLQRRAAMKRYWPNPWHYRTDLEARPLYRGRARDETRVW